MGKYEILMSVMVCTLSYVLVVIGNGDTVMSDTISNMWAVKWHLVV